MLKSRGIILTNLEDVLVPEFWHDQDLSPSKSCLLHSKYLTAKLDLKKKEYTHTIAKLTQYISYKSKQLPTNLVCTL